MKLQPEIYATVRTAPGPFWLWLLAAALLVLGVTIGVEQFAHQARRLKNLNQRVQQLEVGHGEARRCGL